jgi:hypothetical protein
MAYPNWFHTHTKNFEKCLNEYKHLSKLNFLQIGAYTGDASEWLLKNILTNKTSFLTDVDTWRGSDELIHKTFDWENLEALYDKRMSKFSNIKKYRGTSLSYLQTCNIKFDFIYIDGDHTSNGVYQDAIFSFPLLKDQGIMAFDDYLWKHDTNSLELEPRMGIDKFLEEHKNDVEILINGYQIWIKKLKK